MKTELVVAIDPFVKSTESLDRALATVKTFAQMKSSAVIATTVVSPDRIKWPTDFDEAWIKQFERAGKIELTKALKQAGAHDFKTCVINQPFNSTTESIQTLADFAKREAPRALVILTHERKQPAFSLTGSFTSRLIQTSKIPVLALDVRAKKIDAIKRIVVATTFSTRERQTLLSAIDWAHFYDAQLFFLNVTVGLPSGFPPDSSMMGGIERLEAFLKIQEAQATTDGVRWSRKARKSGVDAHYLIETSSIGTSEVIVKASQKLSADLIIMTSVTGPKQALFLGSTTRDVLKNAKRPVLVFS